MQRILVLILFVLMLDACSSGKAALKKGDYYESVIESVHRLRSSPDNKKAKTVLATAYPLAIQYIDSDIQNKITAEDPAKWRNAVRGYESINYLADQIKTSPGAMKIISPPATRFKELADAKGKAADESYEFGINALMKNTREDAKQAYFAFKDANTFQPGFKESIEMMTQAEFNATLRVAYEEINASRVNYGSLIPVIRTVERQFLSFKPISQKDTVPPQQYLRIIFNNYQEDSRFSITTSTEELKKDVKTGTKKGPDGKDVDVMQTVTAKVTYFHKTKRAVAQASFNVVDASSNGMLQNQNVDGVSSWQYDWAIYTGDARALTQNVVNLTKLRESIPNEQYLFNQAMTNLQSNLASQLKSFYSQY